jgi:hypothetical protein
MDNIIEPNESFDFSKLTLAHPIGIQGGAYFTKIEYNSKPLYIQTNKGQSRQGFVKTGKKYYCDLMFDKNSETLIHWFENLEEKCQKLIFSKRDIWFQNTLEECDIETAFNSTIRVYKSGKYYLVRTNIKNLHNNIPAVKIYNENEIPLSMDDVTSETNIISILEIQGIKFTSRNFQIEMELKQVMVLDNEPIFENCLIKNNKKITTGLIEKDVDNKNIEFKEGNNIESKEGNTIEFKEGNTIEFKEGNTIELKEGKPMESNIENIINLEKKYLEELTPIDSIFSTSDNFSENDSFNLELEELKEDIEENNNELKEVQNLDLDNDLEKNLETMQLKKPNQVYYELYKEARNKAKIAKKNALLAYLEAKNIKKTYLIDNLEDSDSDFDAEIEAVSDSELDSF